MSVATNGSALETSAQHTGGDGAMQRRPHVVIVGAGFAGLNAAKQLKDAPVDVTIVDRNNYHKFQPLLYEVAIAGLEPDEIAHNIRDIFRDVRNVKVRMGSVCGLDAENNRLLLHSGDPLPYDYLILAPGAVTNYFGVDGAKEHSFPLKNVPDAINLRNHIFRQFERHDRTPQEDGEGGLNFVIVGGGPTGVETAGAMVELLQIIQRDYPKFDTWKARVVLVEMTPNLLPPYPEPLQQYTRRVLEKRGVEVMTDTTVTRIEPDAIHFEDEESIPTQTVVWGAGVKAHPVMAAIAEAAGAEQAPNDSIKVDDDLRIPGHRNLFVVGDASGALDPEDSPYPGVAQVAIQQGRHAAKQVLRLMNGEPTETFSYRFLGNMATIGRNAAVAELPRNIHLKGALAWFAWVFVHIAKLVGFRNRLNVFINWAYNYLTFDRNARLIIDMVPISDEVAGEIEQVDAEMKEQMNRIAGTNVPEKS